jgi:PPOX class probable F420-dependent enzyme
MRSMGYRDAPDGWWQDFVAELPARTAKLALTRRDGSPHVAPVWVDLERGTGPNGEDVIVFMTGADTVKGKSIQRDGRVALCWDDEQPPFAFVTVTGRATTSTDPDELLRTATGGTRTSRRQGRRRRLQLTRTETSDARRAGRQLSCVGPVPHPVADPPESTLDPRGGRA